MTPMQPVATSPPDYPVLPAANRHWLTPLYDLRCEAMGLGRRFRRDVLARLALGRDERLIDVGCGTGRLLAEAALSHPGVAAVGIDPDPGVLAIAARHLARWRGRVALHAARAEALPLPDGTFDAAVSSLAFHHLPTPAKRAALREIRRVLRPGGRLLLVDFAATAGHRPPWWLRAIESVEYAADQYRGRLPEYLAAGFIDIRCVHRRWPSVEYLPAEKPAPAGEHGPRWQ
ncbi:MAG: class I SAM-dependent methyltransferase [Gemmataceae bacterium]|nr:class I SAM-dependent methyltransferase [Gemmataceae bacterium]